MSQLELKLAIEMLQAKKKGHDRNYAYYDGIHPLVYADQRLYDVFGNTGQPEFVQNWIAAIVDSTLNRMELTRFIVTGDNGQDEDEDLSQRLNQLWQHSGMTADEDDIELAMLVTGEAYAMAEVDDADGITGFNNDPRLCHLFMRPDNPKKPWFGVKVWEDMRQQWHCQLYFDDRIEYYETRTAIMPDEIPQEKQRRQYKSLETLTWQAFQPSDIPELPNPYGRIPMSRFRLNNRLLAGMLLDLIPAQNSINKLLADMMLVAEYGVFPQRWMITNANTELLKNSPSTIWTLPAGDSMSEPTKIGQFDAADLTPYLQAIANHVTYMFIASATPRHYMENAGASLSGEALMTMESQLVAKINTINAKRLAPGYADFASLLLLLDGAEVSPMRIKPQFANPETVQPETMARITQTLTQAGAAIEAAARQAGYTMAQANELATFFVDGVTQ